MKDSVIYVGIDVHKDTNSVCMYDRQDNAFFAEAKLDAGTDIMVRYLEKAVKDYGLSGEFLLGYEAGPTGYGICSAIMFLNLQTVETAKHLKFSKKSMNWTMKFKSG